jgi:hypothetical protein
LLLTRYLHPFISTETGAAQKFKADRQLTADGSQVCDYAGEYVGTLTNRYGQELLKFVELAMDTFVRRTPYLPHVELPCSNRLLRRESLIRDLTEFIWTSQRTA